MSRRKKKLSIPALKKWLSATTGYYQRKFEKSWTGWRRWLRELLRIRESNLSLSGRDQRKLPAAVSYLNPIFWAIQSGAFLLRFLQTRQFLHFLTGLPAVLGILSPVLLELWMVPTEQQLLVRARAAFRTTVQAKDYLRAEFFLRQLTVLQPEDPEHVLQKAVLLAEQGDELRAWQTAGALMNDSGYLPAGEWLAERRFRSFAAGEIPDDDDWDGLDKTLQWILGRQPENARALFMRATGLMMRNENSRARAVLRNLLTLPRGGFAQAYFSLAEVEMALGHPQDAKAAADVAAQQMLKNYSSKNLVLQDFARLIRALLLAHRELEAATLVIEAAESNLAQAAELNDILLQTYLFHCARLRTQSVRSDAEVAILLDRITRAILISPADPRVTEELVAVSGVREMSDSLLETQLNAALAAGVSPGTVHFILGTREMSKSPPNIKEAMVHFELAQQHLPGMPGLLNNIADAMADQPEADMEQALAMVSQAVKYLPDQPAVYDTRGKILLRLGRTLEAIADFERALSDRQNPEKVHEHLAKAWEQAGNSQKAAIHRAMVDELRKTNVAKPAVSGN